MEASYGGVTESVALAVDSNCSSSALLGADATESSNSPNTGLFPLATSPVLSLPKGFPKSHFIDLKKAPFPLSSEEIPRVLGGLLPGMGPKNKCIFLL